MRCANEQAQVAQQTLYYPFQDRDAIRVNEKHVQTPRELAHNTHSSLKQQTRWKDDVACIRRPRAQRALCDLLHHYPSPAVVTRHTVRTTSLAAPAPPPRFAHSHRPAEDGAGRRERLTTQHSCATESADYQAVSRPRGTTPLSKYFKSKLGNRTRPDTGVSVRLPPHPEYHTYTKQQQTHTHTHNHSASRTRAPEQQQQPRRPQPPGPGP
jgi:hypothetical protein